MSDPVEVPGDIAERIRAMCLVLPEVTARAEVTVRAGYSRVAAGAAG